MLTEIMRKRLENDFTYHAPNADQRERHEKINAAALAFSLIIADLTPASREQSLALTAVDNASRDAHSAIARNENEVPVNPAQFTIIYPKDGIEGLNIK